MSLRRLACSLMLLFLGGMPALAARDDVDGDKPQLSVGERQRHLASFDMVWETVRDRHFDPKLGGLDWEAVRKELRPKVEQATTAREVRSVLNDMLKRLKQSHFGILSEDAVEALQGGKRRKRLIGSAETGIEVRIINKDAVVFRIREGSPAAQAGVKTGWVVRAIDDEEIAPVLDKVLKVKAESSMADHYLVHAVADRLQGVTGDQVSVRFQTAEGQEVEKKIALLEPPGQSVRFGHLPTFHINFTGRTLEGGIQYMSWNAFFAPDMVITKVRQIVQENPQAPGMILDLRGNPGGIGIMSVGIGGWFVQEGKHNLGTMTMRTGHMNFILNPSPRSYTGPLAILVDGCSASTTEIFAGGMQDIKRAKVFGTRTAGAALPANIVKLPNGDGFIFAVANYTSSGGQVLEGRGVIPDVEVKLDRPTLLAGRDPQLEAAIAWIKSQKK